MASSSSAGSPPELWFRSYFCDLGDVNARGGIYYSVFAAIERSVYPSVKWNGKFNEFVKNNTDGNDAAIAVMACFKNIDQVRQKIIGDVITEHIKMALMREILIEASASEDYPPFSQSSVISRSQHGFFWTKLKLPSQNIELFRMWLRQLYCFSPVSLDNIRQGFFSFPRLKKIGFFVSVPKDLRTRGKKSCSSVFVLRAAQDNPVPSIEPGSITYPSRADRFEHADIMLQFQSRISDWQAKLLEYYLADHMCDAIVGQEYRSIFSRNAKKSRGNEYSEVNFDCLPLNVGRYGINDIIYRFYWALAPLVRDGATVNPHERKGPNAWSKATLPDELSIENPLPNLTYFDPGVMVDGSSTAPFLVGQSTQENPDNAGQTMYDLLNGTDPNAWRDFDNGTLGFNF